MPVPAAPARIRVAPLDPALAAMARALRVTPGQAGFVGDVAFNVDDARRDRCSDAMAVLADDRVVGFYRLDFAPNTITGRDLGEPTLGVRAMLIGHRDQGCGFGSQALLACCADARVRHPQRRLLALAVHCSNRAAIALYTHAGFGDSGERLPGGGLGPQQLMLKRLRDAVSMADAGDEQPSDEPAVVKQAPA